MKKKISVIVPVFNEEESIKHCYQQIKTVCNNSLRSYQLEIVFVNDGSTDETLKILKTLLAKDAHTKIISFRKNIGKSAALMEGFRRATGTVVITMDADLQDDPQNLPPMLKKLEQGSDVVVGWRKKRNDPLGKKIPSLLFNYFVRRLSGVSIHDVNTGLKVMRKAVSDELELYGELYRFIPLLASARGFSISEIPVIHHARRYGKSKYGVGRMVNGFFDFFTVLFLGSFNQRPLHFFGLIGGAGIGLGTIFGIYLSILRFQGETIGRRPLLLLAMLLILTGMQLISIGFIAELIVSRSRNQHTLPIDYESEST